MTFGPEAVNWPLVAGSGLLAAAVSPLLAGWTAALAGGQLAGWWRLRRVSSQRALTVAVVAAVLGALAATGGPWPAWWLFAIGGAVLVVVDAEKQILPSRFVYPLAGLEVFAFVAVAATEGDSGRLTRAAAAAGVVGAGWFILAFIAGGGIGLGDVRLAVMTGAFLGWLGWAQVLRGQLAVVALAVVTAVVVGLVYSGKQDRRMRVPLGPALVVSTLLMAWT